MHLMSLGGLMKATDPSSPLKTAHTYIIVCNFEAFLKHPGKSLDAPLSKFPKFQLLISQVSELKRNLPTPPSL